MPRAWHSLPAPQGRYQGHPARRTDVAQSILGAMSNGQATVAIEAIGLRKEYGRGGTTVAVDDLDLVVEGPGVHGFLGPNGSGKTTTIRCLLGLIRPTSGSVKVLGADVKQLHTVIHRVGALVETPKFFPTFSGRKNLRMLSRVAGVADERVDEVLEIVGLSERGRDAFASYSLGMKQRLAVSATLLRDPDVIILDEPANGLDPAGIVEIRTLMRDLAEQGKTVFVSSHQLGEVQQTCDVLTIINKGRVIRTGSVADVVNSVSQRGLRVTIDNAKAAQEVLTGAGLAARVGAEPSTVEVDLDPSEGGAHYRKASFSWPVPASA